MLHEVEVNDQLTLFLVSNLEHDAQTLAELFKFRVEVEFDIRNLKVTMDTENIRAKKVDTFKKELYTSVVAYNLVGQFRRQAAQINNVAPRRMSFKKTWTTFQVFCYVTCTAFRRNGEKHFEQRYITPPKTSFPIVRDARQNERPIENAQRMYSSTKEKNRPPKSNPVI